MFTIRGVALKWRQVRDTKGNHLIKIKGTVCDIRSADCNQITHIPKPKIIRASLSLLKWFCSSFGKKCFSKSTKLYVNVILWFCIGIREFAQTRRKNLNSAVPSETSYLCASSFVGFRLRVPLTFLWGRLEVCCLMTLE